MKYHTLFLLKTRKGVYNFVVCCSQIVNLRARKKNQNLSSFVYTIKVETVWLQIRPDVLNWIQTVCNGYQQTTTAGEEVNERHVARKSVFGVPCDQVTKIHVCSARVTS